MSEHHSIEIRLVGLSDAHEFAPLLAAYVQSLTRGAPRRPDDFYSETLLQDDSVDVIGARVDGSLVGFAIFHDLPDPVSGLRSGVVDHLYVHHDHRGQGIARALIDLLAEDADTRGWVRLVLNAPRQSEDGRRIYEQIAAPADWTSHVIRFDVD